MDSLELSEYFILHSPDFSKDLDIPEVDDKHTKILKEAYREIDSKKAFSQFNFRGWKSQSDLNVPAQLSFVAARSQGLANILSRYFYTKLFRRRADKSLLSAILDDIEIIKMVGAENLLIDNPVHLTPGAKEIYSIAGTSVNLRWLRYIYLLKRILDQNLLADGGVWLDVGSFYGGLQGLVRKYNPEARIIMVDFHHQLCRSFIYLSQLFPNATHIMPDQLSEYADFKLIPKGAIMYVPASEYERVANQRVNLATNFVSFGEMRRKFLDIYMTSRLFKESQKVFLVNRIVSAPFFEKTYDTDVSVLDYLSTNRKIEYFDIFPMHHYMSVKRKLFGREQFRNASSGYFEMVSSNENF